MSAEQLDQNKKGSLVVIAVEKIFAPLSQLAQDRRLSKKAKEIQKDELRSRKSQACDHKTMTLYIGT